MAAGVLGAAGRGNVHTGCCAAENAPPLPALGPAERKPKAAASAAGEVAARGAAAGELAALPRDGCEAQGIRSAGLAADSMTPVSRCGVHGGLHGPSTGSLPAAGDGPATGKAGGAAGCALEVSVASSTDDGAGDDGSVVDEGCTSAADGDVASGGDGIAARGGGGAAREGSGAASAFRMREHSAAESRTRLACASGVPSGETPTSDASGDETAGEAISDAAAVAGEATAGEEASAGSRDSEACPCEAAGGGGCGGDCAGVCSGVRVAAAAVTSASGVGPACSLLRENIMTSGEVSTSGDGATDAAATVLGKLTIAGV